MSERRADFLFCSSLAIPCLSVSVIVVGYSYRFHSSPPVPVLRTRRRSPYAYIFFRPRCTIYSLSSICVWLRLSSCIQMKKDERKLGALFLCSALESIPHGCSLCLLPTTLALAANLFLLLFRPPLHCVLTR